MSLLLGVAWAAFGLTGMAGRATARPAAATPAHISGPKAPSASPGVRTSPTPPKAPTHPTAPKANGAKPAVQPVIVVTLHWGDTLFALARSHHTTVSALQRLNGLGTSTLIYAGHRLRVPAATTSGAGASSADSRLQGLGGSTGASPGAGASTQQRGAAAAIAYAEAQLGKPYRWGAAGPDAFDCSGLTMRAWQAGGVALPRVTYDQARTGTRIHRAALQPGDLVFTNGFGHVALYLGGATVIQAPHTGAEVSTAPLPPDSSVDAYVHVGS
jgi:cell wall-associated NlpC family hydrolase